MICCPKCSSLNVSGPKYVGQNINMGFVRDSLRYTCAICGFYVDEPCHDELSERSKDAK